MDHIWLAIYWILFGIVHSVMASLWFKNKLRKVSGPSFKYYRLLYTFISFLTLVAVIYYQYSFPSFLLWKSLIWVNVLVLVPVALGMTIMIICIYKYFMMLSGFGVFTNRNEDSVLIIEGMHRYVRHPLYFGTMVFLWGLFLIYPYLNNLICCSIVTLYTILGTILEEKKLLIQFGNEYRKYQHQVPMLLPFTKFRKLQSS